MTIDKSPQLIVLELIVFSQVNQAVPITAPLFHLTYHPVCQLLILRKVDHYLILLHLESSLMLILALSPLA